MNAWPVTYTKQKGPGADKHNNDCWTASALMLLNTYNLAWMPVDQFFDMTMLAGDAGLFWWDLPPALAKHGLTCDAVQTPTIPAIYDYLTQSRPMIVLVNYGVLVDEKLTQFTAFRDGHYMVVTGADISTIYAHDPYRTNDSGVNLAIPIPVFKRCLQVAIVPRLPIQDLAAGLPAKTHTVAPPRINVRSGPGSDFAWVRYACQGERVSILDTRNKYTRIAPGEWVYLPYLDPV